GYLHSICPTLVLRACDGCSEDSVEPIVRCWEKTVFSIDQRWQFSRFQQPRDPFSRSEFSVTPAPQDRAIFSLQTLYDALDHVLSFLGLALHFDLEEAYLLVVKVIEHRINVEFC